MKKTITLTCAALLATLPSLAFAQTTQMQNAPAAADGVTKPSSPKAETPAVGTYQGRSANTSSQQADPAKDTDGLHPNGPALNNTAKP